MSGAVSAQTSLISLSPARNAQSVPRTTAVTATFDEPLSLEAAPQQALKIFSTQSTRKQAATTTVSGNTIKLTPGSGAGFKPGETISATITTAVQGSSGQNLAKPQVFQFIAATSPSTGTFNGDSELTVGNNTTNATLGDIDGDGDLDLLTANYNNKGTVTVRLNNGKGAFSGNQEVAVGPGPYQVVLGDVDGDGDLDLLTPNANTTINTVSVRLNDGKGTFGGTQEVKVGENPHAVALGDVDGDGDLDLLAANYTDSSSNYATSTVSVR
ncbi:MAG TPA: Ig-like domain-containing protein, partial [Hymenobacter sp.]